MSLFCAVDNCTPEPAGSIHADSSTWRTPGKVCGRASPIPLPPTSVGAMPPVEDLQLWPGTAYPFGATFDGSGTNFALFSEVAESVELCLFDEELNETRIQL